MTEYQIDDVFTSNPAKSGWQQFQGTSLDWDSLEKVGGELGHDEDCRYIKYLGKALNQQDNITALFTFMVDNCLIGSADAIIGFFNVDRAAGKDECFGMKVICATGNPQPQLYIAYDDSTKQTTSGLFTFTQGSKYLIAVRFVPEDNKAYLEVYDFLTQTLLHELYIVLDETKSFTLNQVGISEVDTVGSPKSEAWIYDFKAVGDTEPVDYSNLYATPDEVRQLTNLDAVQDMTDSQIANIILTMAMPQVNARFRAEAYDAPFDTGDNTPPMVRTITALLSAAYAARVSYIGHAPSESPAYAAYLDEVNTLWKSILSGYYELLDINGQWIERTEATSTDMLTTTSGQTVLFTLDDFPDITDIMTGGSFGGQEGC